MGTASALARDASSLSPLSHAFGADEREVYASTQSLDAPHSHSSTRSIVDLGLPLLARCGRLTVDCETLATRRKH
jgi:hypothetical protein